jgi:serine/threonine-protein kinase RsbT
VTDPAVLLPIRSDSDIVTARQRGRALAQEIGLSSTDATLVATAISEVARNIVTYAKEGEVELAPVSEGMRKGLRVIARDRGPGIADLDRAMRDGYSTGRSLGLGLPGAKRLMDEFDIVSSVGAGTTVTMLKWAS